MLLLFQRKRLIAETLKHRATISMLIPASFVMRRGASKTSNRIGRARDVFLAVWAIPIRPANERGLRMRPRFEIFQHSSLERTFDTSSSANFVFGIAVAI